MFEVSRDPSMASSTLRSPRRVRWIPRRRRYPSGSMGIGNGPWRVPPRLSILLSILVLSLVSAPSASALPEKFFGLHWTPSQGAADMEAVARSGAKYYHLQLSRTSTVAAAYDPIFQLAWEQGITILPYLY